MELVDLAGSSEIAAYGWEPKGPEGFAAARVGVLALRFHRGGVWYYLGVPESVFENFLLSDSRGVFFHRHIRDRFIAVREEDESRGHL